jgi:hypothetical protein
MSNYLDRAIKSLKPSAEYTFNDDDYSTIKWIILDGDAPTKAQVEAEILKLKKLDADKVKNDAAKKAALLEKLGITEDEAKLLLS